MNRTSVVCVVFLAYSAGLVAIPQSIAADRRSEESMASRLLVKELREKLKTRKIDEAKLHEKITANKEQHKELEASRKLSEDSAREQLQTWYSGEVDRMLNSTRTRRGASALSEEERAALTTPPTDALDENLQKNFPSAFSNVRKQAVDTQWAPLENQYLYPSAQEFEKTETSKLQADLLDRYKKALAEPLFEENDTKLRGYRVPEVLKEASEQQSGQLRATYQRKWDDIADKSAGKIEDTLRTDVEKYRNDLQKSGSKHVFEAFPSVQQKISERAGKLATEKFWRAIDNMEFASRPDDTRTWLEQNLRDYASRGKCLDALKGSYRTGFQNTAIRQYLKGVNKDDAKALQPFLEQLFDADRDVANSLERLMDKTLTPTLDEIRKSIATSQLKTYFPKLVDGTWKPQADFVESLEGAVGFTLSQPLEMKGISTKDPLSLPLLDETNQLIYDAEHALVEKGVAALRKQLKCANNEADKLEEAMQEEGSVPSLETLISRLTEATRKAWSDEDQDLLKRYPSLFSRVDKEIDTRAKAMLPREIARRDEVQRKEELARMEAIKAQEEQQKAKETERLAKEAQQAAAAKAAQKGGSSGDKKNSGGGDKGRGGGSGGGMGPGRGSGGWPDPPPPDLIVDFHHDPQSDVVRIKSVMFRKKLAGAPESSQDKLPSQPFDTVPPTPPEEKWLSHFEMAIKPALCEDPSNVVHAKIVDWFERWMKAELFARKMKPDEKVTLFVLCRVRGGLVPFGSIEGLRRCMQAAQSRFPDNSVEMQWLAFYQSPKEGDRIPPDFREQSRPVTAQVQYFDSSCIASLPHQRRKVCLSMVLRM